MGSWRGGRKSCADGEANLRGKVTRNADVFAPLLLHGGALWEVVVDYGGSTSGADYVCEARAQVYESDTIS